MGFVGMVPPEYGLQYYLGLVFCFGVPFAALLVLYNAVLGDIIDLDEKTTGFRREAMYYGMEGFFTKNDLAYLERMYQAGAASCFDALAAHAYGLTFPPDEAPAPDVINFRRVELLREVMVAHGDGDKPVYVTESGWNDHPRWVHAVRPAQRIEYTIGAYEWARQHWPWCTCVAAWAFRYPASTLSYHDYYAFVTTDLEPKEIYLEVQGYARRGTTP